MLGTVLLLIGGVLLAIFRVVRAEERKHEQVAKPKKRNSTRFALLGFAIIYIGICAWVSAGDWQSSAPNEQLVVDAPTLSDDTFRSATLVNHALVLDFGASWCVSCKKTAPEFAKLAAEGDGKFRCFTMDVDKSPITAKLLNIELLPCMMVIVGGKVLARRTGPATETELHHWIDVNLPK